MNLDGLPTYRKYISLNTKVLEKNNLILSYCKGKKVLDMGCIDHSFETALSLGDNWLHKQIKDCSTSVKGLDILETDAAELNKLGYNIVAANAESFDLFEKFDVIVAGDLIEHLSNVGLFLDSVRKHMHAESLFIISTPNPACIEQISQAIFNKALVVNSQHTQWLDPVVAWQILNRHQFSIVNFHWVNTRFSNKVWSTVWRHLVNFITDTLIKKVPLLRRDFVVIVKL